MLLSYRSLREGRDWSLTDAFSEEVELTNANAAANPIDAAGIPLAAGHLLLTIMMMEASSSRFIDMTKAANFFYSDLVLLAPNQINKFSSVFSIFEP